MIQPNKLKPFDLEAAKRGDPIVTRDGRKVQEFHHFAARKDCGAIVDGDLVILDERGRAKQGDLTSSYDLFMSITRLAYVNLYESGAAFHFSDEATARRCADYGAIAIAVPVEIEDYGHE